ncbi:hypothetical protein [Leucobacter sp. L43]|uniref:hypothetical protein n=1 Tax=Leucobacter sp. L43 TaxID=2798040 RepID=UPI001903F321|nr:hypothetical protein [Leucobacter sp. L43]
MAQEEFDRIVDAVPELKGLGATAPDGFMVLVGVGGEQVRISRLNFMEHTNAIADALRDPGADLKGVLGPVAGLPPLARRVVLSTAYQSFKDWLLERCPDAGLPLALVHVVPFVLIYRGLLDGAPEYSGEFFYEGEVRNG